jgi:hypothetical protein
MILCASESHESLGSYHQHVSRDIGLYHMSGVAQLLSKQIELNGELAQVLENLELTLRNCGVTSPWRYSGWTLSASIGKMMRQMRVSRLGPAAGNSHLAL